MIELPSVKPAVAELQRWVGSGARNIAILSVVVPSSASSGEKDIMEEKRRVLYKKGVFVCPGCRQSYVQEKWIEEWRIRCHRCTYRGTLTEVSVEEHMEEETFRR
ncbi:MAG: hypothetical protein HC938_10495 [Nitrospira sp.]|nr:hypothetical protein [Nitrospira sp.]